MWTDSRVLFTVLVGAVAAMRLVELGVSRRNVRHLMARGGVESGARHYPWMVALHTGWLVAAPAEVWLARRPLVPPLAAAMLLVLAVGVGLRLWAIRTLGRRWTTRVVVVGGWPLVSSGPYRWLRHPNYVGVAIEIVALPLVHTAWVTALLFGAANALVLRVRIAAEEAALRRAGLEQAPTGSG